MAITDEMSKYDDTAIGLGEAAVLGGTGLAMHQASKRLNKKRKAKTSEDKFRKTITKWKVSKSDIAATKDYAATVQSQIDELVKDKAPKKDINKLRRLLDTALSTASDLEYKQGLKERVAADPTRDATKIRDAYDKELKSSSLADKKQPVESPEKQYIRQNIEMKKEELQKYTDAAKDRLKSGGPAKDNLDFEIDKKVIADNKPKLETLDADLSMLKGMPDTEIMSNTDNAKYFKQYTSGQVGSNAIFSDSDKVKIEDIRAANTTKAAKDTGKPDAEKVKTFKEKLKSVPRDIYDRATKVSGKVRDKAGLGAADVPTDTSKPSYYDKQGMLGKGVIKTGKAAYKGSMKGATPLVGGNLFNAALQTKRNLEERGISPIVQNLIDSGASPEEIDSAIKEDMLWTYAENIGIKELAELPQQVKDWATTDMSVYDRIGDVVSAGGDVVTGVAQGMYDGLAGLIDIGRRATGEGDFSDVSKGQVIAGYDTEGFGYSPLDLQGAASSGSGGGEGIDSGVSAPGFEVEDTLNKRKTAEARMAIRNNAVAKQQAAYDQLKYAGYDTAEDYAAQYGVKALDGSDGRYGNTPIYEGVDEFGNRSFSDVPTNVMDPAKYDKVTGQAANKARKQFIQYEKALKERAKQQARGPAFAGVSDEQYHALGPKGQAQAGLAYNKASISKNKEKDLYERNKATQQNLYGEMRASELANLSRRMGSGLSTPEERAQAGTEIVKGQIEEGWRIPFTDAPIPGAYSPDADDIPGVWFESTPEELRPLHSAYSYATGYKK